MTRILTVIALFIWGVNPALAEWPAESVALGARDHPKVLQRFGGEVQNPALSAYVARIGVQVVAVSDRAGESWHFTVLDSPEVNAFALPGGYVYVTRGLLALANNESELAAVLAHEVSHVIEAHVEARLEAQSDALVDGALSALVTGIFGGGDNRVGDAVRQGMETAFGQIGAYSKAQEFAADAGGIELLRRAGYRPAAQADFLGAMVANAALKAAMAGRVYDAENAPIFANHPAPAERQVQALALAGDAGGRQGGDAYLTAIDGMVFGQNQRGGFIRGQRFIQPELGFYFEAAEGLRIQNTTRQINILGPNRSTLVLSGGRDAGDLGAALQAWAAQIPRRDRQGRDIGAVRMLEINGMEAATGTLTLRKRGQRSRLQMTVIRFNDGLIRFAGTVRRGDDDSADLHWQTVQSFAVLSAEGAAEYRQTYVHVRPVRAGETVADLAADLMGLSLTENQFRVLNGLNADEDMAAGRRVKMVSF